MTNSKRGGSAVFEKYCAVLDVLSKSPTPLRLSSLARQANLAKSTVHRLAAVLCAEKLAIYDDTTQTYKLGLRVLHWASNSWGNSDLVQIATERMIRLQEKTGLHLILAVRDGDEVVFLTGTEYRRGSLAPAVTGQRAPLHCTAVGKTIAAFLEPEQRTALMDRLNLGRHTKNTITDKKALAAEFDQIRARGIATNIGEEFETELSFAAPIRDYQGRVVAALSLVCLGTADDIERLFRWEDDIVSAAHDISIGIGLNADR